MLGSLKELIKIGCSKAVIKLSIKNGGKDAFKEDLYGNLIIVERTLKIDGSSSYKLMNSSNKTVSNKKEELVEMLDHYEIQIDNPVQILNQDTSRQFLNSSTPSEKYAFFMKATRLESLSNDYVYIKNQQELIESSLERKKKSMTELKKDVDEWENKYNAIQNVQEMKEELKKFEQMLLWSYVKDVEDDVNLFEEKRNAFLEKRESQLLEINGKQKEKQILENDCVACEERMKQKAEMLETISGEGNAPTQAIKLLNQQKQSLETSIKQSDEDKKIAQKEKDSLSKKIADMKKKAERDIEKENAVIFSKLKELQNIKETLEAKVTQLEQKITKTDNEYESVFNKKDEFRKCKEQCQREMNGIEGQLRQLKSGGNSSLSAFGRDHPGIVKAIEQEKDQFTVPPVGPLGAYVKLLDDEWAFPVEECLNDKLLGSYIVHDKRDEERLFKIFNKVVRGGNQQPTIIKRSLKSEPYRIPSNPVSQHKRVIDAIQIDNPAVFNVVIDMARAERTLMFSDSTVAYDVVLTRNAPIREGYTKKGERVVGGETFQHYQNFNDNWTRRLGASVEAMIASHERRLSAKRAEVSHHNGKVVSEERVLSQLKNDKMKWKKEKAMNEDKLAKTASEIDSLSMIEKEDILGHIAAMQDDISDFDGKIDTLERKMAVCRGELTDLDAKYVPHQEKLKEVKKNMAKIEASLTESTSELDNFSSLIAKASKKLKILEVASEKVNAELQALEEMHPKLIAKLAEAKEGAESKFPERKNSRKSTSELEKLYNSREKIIEREEKS